MTSTLRKLSVLAGVAAFAAVAGATSISNKDTQIIIDKALNSPTLSVRYTGAKAKLIEFRLNGESIGTRALSNSKANGETTFNLDVNLLKEGDNSVEVRLYDGAGKLVGTEKTTLSTEKSMSGPVFLETPKVGQTVQGPVEIKLGLAQAMKNISVSFFVDNNWKSLINNPPFSYLWDTSRETNGWHEVEAWVVDEGSATLKTKKTRVLVNNPGGKTERVTTLTAPIANESHTTIESKPSAVKSLDNMPKSEANTTANSVNPTFVATAPNAIRTNAKGTVGTKSGRLPGVAAVPNSANVVPHVPKPLEAYASRAHSAIEHTAMGSKPVNEVNGLAMSSRIMSPGTTVAKAGKGSMDLVIRGGGTANPVTIKASGASVNIVKGTRIPATGKFAISFNNSFVNFDVSPRFLNGVPMSPFRHLVEKAGGKVDWEHATKTVRASADGHALKLQIGDKFGMIDKQSVALEIAPFIENGRTIVPLSFIREALNVEVDYDAGTGHVVITSKK